MPNVIRVSHDERRLRRKQIAEAVAGGATIAQAARMFGVSIRTAQSACQEHDVAPRGPDDANRKSEAAEALAKSEGIAVGERPAGRRRSKVGRPAA